MQHVSLDMTRVQSLAQELQPCLSGTGIQWDEEGWHYRFFFCVSICASSFVAILFCQAAELCFTAAVTKSGGSAQFCLSTRSTFAFGLATTGNMIGLQPMLL